MQWGQRARAQGPRTTRLPPTGQFRQAGTGGPERAPPGAKEPEIHEVASSASSSERGEPRPCPSGRAHPALQDGQGPAQPRPGTEGTWGQASRPLLSGCEFIPTPNKADFP